MLLLHGLGWALLYTGLVGIVIGLIAHVALTLLDRRTAWLRYVVTGGALVLTVGALPLSALSIWSAYGDHDARVADFATDLMRQGAPDATGALPGGWSVSALDAAVGDLHDHEVPPWIDSRGASLGGVLLALLAAAWLVGAARRLLTLVAAVGVVRDLRRRATARPSARWIRILAEARRDLGVTSRVDLRVSTEVDGPMVIGWRRPAILLSTDAHDALSDVDARSVIAHELAHVRRADYLVNLIQMTAEALLFFTPVTVWLSERLRDEREYCSDDLAHQAIGGPVTRYLRALETLEARRMEPGPALAVPAGRSLISRMHRMARADGRRRPRLDAEVLLAVVVLVGLWVPTLAISRTAEYAAVALMKHELALPHDYRGLAVEQGLELEAATPDREHG